MADKQTTGLSGIAAKVTVTVPSGGGVGQKTLLNNVILQINPREFICVLGPSGAGKSTLVRTMLGEREITASQLLLGGHDVLEKADTLRGAIGYVPQRDINPASLPVERALHFASSVRLPAETVAPQRRATIDRVLGDVGLESVRNATIGKLSGGEAKRASLAAELLATPGLLVVDEATSSLNPATEARFMRLLAAQARAGTTVIAVTHHLDNVDRADKLLILGHGEVVWFGSRVEALGHFDVHRLADVYLAIEDKPAGSWGTSWRQRLAENETLATDQPADPAAASATTAALADVSIPGIGRPDRGRHGDHSPRPLLAGASCTWPESNGAIGRCHLSVEKGGWCLVSAGLTAVTSLPYSGQPGFAAVGGKGSGSVHYS